MWFVCSFFVSTLLILCTVTVICATPVMRIGNTSGRRNGGSIEGNHRHHHERYTSSQSRERQRIASQYFSINEKLEWYNPCGGNHVPPDPSWQPPKPSIYDEINALENLKAHIEPSLQTIENLIRDDELIDPLSRWPKHEENYLFLPTLNNTQNHNQGPMSDTSQPHVKRRPQLWHRDIQVYIAALQYLAKKQLTADIDSNNGTDNHKNLEDLMTNARSLLCEIEILVNNTAGNLRKPRGRTEMGNILKFEVKNPTSTSRYLDRRFTKEKYLRYVSGLLHVVTRRIERKKLNAKLQQQGLPLNNNSSKRKLRKQQNRAQSNENRSKRKGSGRSNEAQRNRLRGSKSAEARLARRNQQQQQQQMKKHKRTTTTTTSSPMIVSV